MGLALLVFILDLLVVPSLLAFTEWVLGRGLTIEDILRINFAYLFWILLLLVMVFLYLWPASDVRIRLLLFVLGIEILVLLGVWVLDRGAPFESEGSALTFFSALVLILASLAAFSNAYPWTFLPPISKLGRWFWSLTCFAFLLAGLDEFFVIHEQVAVILEPIGNRIGLSPGLVQDFTTISYAVGSIVFVVVFGKYFFRAMLGAGLLSGWILLSAISLFALAVINDTADVLLEQFFPYLDPRFAMNFAEEMLEFTAANLFLISFCVAFMERVGSDTFTRGIEKAGTVKYRLVSIVLVAGTLLVSVAVTVLFRPSRPGIVAPRGYHFSIFADATDELNAANQIVFQPGLGLLVGNERSGNILRFDSKGKAQVLVDPKTGLVDPDGIAVGKESIYVADDGGRQILEYANDGSLITRVGTEWVSPKGVALDRNGVLYVSDRGLRMIVRIERRNIAVVASALDGLSVPEQLTFDDNGNLYVSDRVEQAIYRISPKGKLEKFITVDEGVRCPEAIAMHRSYLYVADRCSVAVYRFGLDGSGGPLINFTHGFRDLAGIAFDDRNNLYVSVGSPYRPHNFILRVQGIK